MQFCTAGPTLWITLWMLWKFHVDELHYTIVHAKTQQEFVKKIRIFFGFHKNFGRPRFPVDIKCQVLYSINV
jgi:hypothetical protein